jgi:hypothetical protein
MEMRIRGDRLGTESSFHVNGINKGSMDTGKQQTFPMDTRKTIKVGAQRRFIQPRVEAGSNTSTLTL